MQEWRPARFERKNGMAHANVHARDARCIECRCTLGRMRCVIDSQAPSGWAQLLDCLRTRVHGWAVRDLLLLKALLDQ